MVMPRKIGVVSGVRERAVDENSFAYIGPPLPAFGVYTMPIPIVTGAPTLLLRRAAYESSGLTRGAIDERLGLTADEFRVEENLVVIGPIYEANGDVLSDFIAELERVGLVYFDDFFELSGNWPDWLRIHASAR